MTIKNTFKIHILFYLVGFVCFLTGNFKDFAIVTAIVFFHEMGHVTVALFFRWHIEKIVMLPFGGITIFKEYLNRPIYQEFWIAIAGPVFQVSLLLFFKNPLFVHYNILLLLFNLLPIVPLDGSKIIHLFFDTWMPFYRSFCCMLRVSIIMMITLFVLRIDYGFSLLFACVLFFLGVEIIRQHLKKDYYFQKFLLERYLYSFSFRKEKTITKVKNMYRGYRHLFLIEDTYHTERQILMNLFDK